ncbi:MAG TPA: hypothetical protein VIA18_05745 [Polyangia bacterium]|nr:hypothetical protein [Polyangia bacterium]HWE28460.1 hypothetical protein [Polyangia bacterium]
MSWETVETVGDEAAAEVLLEALAAADIASEMRRVPGSPYGPVKLEIEVRVASADAPRARAVLAQLSEEAEAAARAEAHVPADAVPVDAVRQPPKTRPSKLTSQQRRTLYAVGAAISVTLLVLLSFWTTQAKRPAFHHAELR